MVLVPNEPGPSHDRAPLIRQRTYYIRRRRVTHYPVKRNAGAAGCVYWGEEVLAD